MPQMSPIMWTPMLIFTTLMLILIKVTLYFEDLNSN
nr:ATP synthase F0 subunit 8 [Cixiini sp.]